MAITPLLRAAVAALFMIMFVSIDAGAAVRSVTVNATRDSEHARGYTHAEITIEGSVARADGSVGRYSVPAVVIYPRRGGNGVGVVDWLNSASYHFFPSTPEFGTVEFTLLSTGTHLFDKGYTYLSVQWDKAVTEIFGPAAPPDGQPHNHLVYGSIERSADAWEILRDAARLLKDPRPYPGAGRPARVSTVLSSGYSQGGALQLELLAEGLDPARAYDGHLVQMIGLTCWKREDVGPHFGFLGECGALPARGDHAPVMVLASETDMVAFHPSVLGFGKSAFFTRNPGNPLWRQYEMAGVSHLPAPILPLGIANQGNADARPLFRAAFDNLAAWARRGHRAAPPAARYLEGRPDATGAFVPVTDGDGHFAGGLRLPHVESRISGHAAGAPLGRNAPLNPAGQDPFHPFVVLGGTFARFSDGELLARYVSRDRYVRRVRCAADALAARRYITLRDRSALVAAALVEPLPLPPVDDDGDDLARLPGGRGVHTSGAR
jgi:hypothetical protein